jgi:PAS domain S-box-containing protein
MTGVYQPFNPDSDSEIKRLQAALSAAMVGTWELDPSGNRFLSCERFNSIFGHDFEHVTSFEKILSQINPDDRARVNQEFISAINADPGKSLDIVFRTVESEGSAVRWINFKGQNSRHGRENIKRLSGVVMDFTSHIDSKNSLAASEERFRSLIEEAPVATGLFVGEDMVIEVANDVMISYWGKDRGVIGKTLLEAMPELTGQPFLRILKEVYSHGRVYEAKSVAARLENAGQLNTYYFNFTYKPLFNTKGDVYAILNTAVDVTAQVNAIQNLKASEAKFRSLIEEAPVAICLFTGEDMIVEMANQPMVTYWGKDMSVIGKPLREAMPELDGQPFHGLLADIYVTGKTYVAHNARVDIEVDGVLGIYYFDFTYKPLLDKEGKVYTIINISIDVTARVLGQKALEESEGKLRSVIANAPAAIGVFSGRDLVVEMPNQSFIDIVGKGADIAGKPLREVMPELENQPFLQILDDVYTSGKMYQGFGTQVNIVRKGIMTHNFYDITYSPLFDDQGNVYAILDIATDVTEKVMEHKRIEQSQMELLALFEQSPVAIAMIREKDLAFTMANPFYGNLVGRSVDEIVGKSLLEALPELEGQGFQELLRDVIETGVPFTATERPVQIIHKEELVTIYVDMTYQPKKEKDDTISGVLVIATDVTGQVLARKNIEQAEKRLRDAVELAGLGTWQIDIQSGAIAFSDRLRDWFSIGGNDPVTLEKIYNAVKPQSLPLIQRTLAEAGSGVVRDAYDMEFTLNATADYTERVLHATGATIYDSKGEVSGINGNIQDVSAERELQRTLEKLVMLRTEELEAVNEEYLATNEELTHLNEKLSRSNENLQHFAYVASHDLQEPLRKIQAFGGLLKSRFAAELGSGAEYLDRMQAAANRMSMLIEDLLTFSRVSQKESFTIISLNEVVQTVLADLDLTIHQTQAVVSVGELPVLIGDRLQFGQLFLNLISNALKFRSMDAAPEITITAIKVESSEIDENVKPDNVSNAYHRIDVSDNGIGFDEKHTARIFQIFQRLHGKAEYPGTGIGLAICERVVGNHGGAISAKSRIGQGSVFSVYLPA